MSAERIVIRERVKSFLKRTIVYEEDGELKTFDAPAQISYDDFVALFEKEKGVKIDPVTGKCRDVRTRKGKGTPKQEPVEPEPVLEELPEPEPDVDEQQEDAQP